MILRASFSFPFLIPLRHPRVITGHGKKAAGDQERTRTWWISRALGADRMQARPEDPPKSIGREGDFIIIWDRSSHLTAT